MWKLATGTVTQKRPGDIEEKPKKRKLKKKKAHRKKRVSSTAIPGSFGKDGDQTCADEASSDGDTQEEEESNW